MRHMVVLFAILTISIWTAAQSQTTSASGNSTMPPTTVVPEVVAGPGGLSTNTGTDVIIPPPSAPLVTPEVHLQTVMPAVGARNATPGNTAGAANATTEVPVAPTIITTVPQFATAGVSANQTPAPEETTGTSSAPTAPGAAPTGTSTVGAPAPTGNNAIPFDWGVGSISSLAAGDSADGSSLAEIARRDRQRAAGGTRQVYTNDDINRINSQPEVWGQSNLPPR